MELLKDWTACICITLVVAVAFSLVTPKGKMSSFYKILISLFIFLSFIYPLKNTTFELDNREPIFNSEYVENSYENSVTQMLEAKIQTVLNDNGIKNSSIIVKVKQTNDNIEINSVSVAISDEYENADVQEIIFKELGINAEVHKFGD